MGPIPAPTICRRIEGSRKLYTVGYLFELEVPGAEPVLTMALWDATLKQVGPVSVDRVDWSKSDKFTTATEAEIKRMHFKLTRWTCGLFGVDPPSSCDCGCGQTMGRKRRNDTKGSSKPEPKRRSDTKGSRKKKQTRVNAVVVAARFSCDSCSVNPIQGLRYTCGSCEDYDLCGQCHKDGKHGHDEDHPMLAVNSEEAPPKAKLTAATKRKQAKLAAAAVQAKEASAKLLAAAQEEMEMAKGLMAEAEGLRKAAKEAELALEAEEKSNAQEKARKEESRVRRKAKKDQATKEKVARKSVVQAEESVSDDGTGDDDEKPRTADKNQARQGRNYGLSFANELLRRELKMHKQLAALTYQQNVSAIISQNLSYP
jgi:hypothetical protein